MISSTVSAERKALGLSGVGDTWQLTVAKPRLLPSITRDGEDPFEANSLELAPERATAFQPPSAWSGAKAPSLYNWIGLPQTENCTLFSHPIIILDISPHGKLSEKFRQINEPPQAPYSLVRFIICIVV